MILRKKMTKALTDYDSSVVQPIGQNKMFLTVQFCKLHSIWKPPSTSLVSWQNVIVVTVGTICSYLYGSKIYSKPKHELQSGSGLNN